MNILVNSIDALDVKFMEDQSDQTVPRLFIRTEPQPHSIIVRIEDNGIGIPAAIQDRIFEPFFTTKPVGQGTGLGMAISHQIITERHQGTIECFSEEGVGTEFIIEIPIRLSTTAGTNITDFERCDRPTPGSCAKCTKNGCWHRIMPISDPPLNYSDIEHCLK